MLMSNNYLISYMQLECEVGLANLLFVARETAVMCVCVCVCVGVGVGVFFCMCMCVCVCVRVYGIFKHVIRMLIKIIAKSCGSSKSLFAS